MIFLFPKALARKREVSFCGSMAQLKCVLFIYNFLLYCNYKKTEELIWYFNKSYRNLCSVLLLMKLYSCCVRKSLNSICLWVDLITWDSDMQNTTFFWDSIQVLISVVLDLICCLEIAKKSKKWKAAVSHLYFTMSLKTEFLLDVSIGPYFNKKEKQINEETKTPAKRPPFFLFSLLLKALVSSFQLGFWM